MSESDFELRLKTAGRNDHCPCGSGKKYKKCHLAEDQSARAASLKALEASKDTEAEVSAKGADGGIRSTKHQMKQPRFKGRASDGEPKNIPRRGAV